MYNNQPAKLILSKGSIFNGYAFGAIGIASGEVCFNTGMTGYQEILTDPSYCGQLITMTSTQIGNYGVNSHDTESGIIHANGLIVREGSSVASNYRASDTLGHYLQKNNIVSIQGIDTRALTRILRIQGSMNGIISSDILENKKLEQMLDEHPDMMGLNLAKRVSCSSPYIWENTSGKYKVAVIDYGIKHNILRLLQELDCQIKIFPYDVSSNDIQLYNPDGIFLSNGPGDPAALNKSIKTVKKLIENNIPMFGICLGHQILSLAFGGKTYKLKFGHRGCNHPVKNNISEAIEITSQNHGFSVDANSLPENIEITHISLNDNTVEGIRCIDKPIFSVQHHPEASPGPHDSQYLFNQFEKLMKIYKKQKRYA